MITVRTSKIKDTPLNNVTSIISMDNNSHTVTRRATKKRYAGRNKEITKRKKLISLKRYMTTSSSLELTH